MSSAFIELLRKSNLDLITARKPLKTGARTEDIIVASFVDAKSKTLKLAACLDQVDSVTVWLTSLDERTFQLNARLLDLAELGETMVFLSQRLQASDFTLTQANATKADSQLDMTVTRAQSKQSITLQLHSCIDEGEKVLILSKLLVHVHKRNEQLSSEISAQQVQIKDLVNRSQQNQSRSNDSKSLDAAHDRNGAGKGKERTQMSLINPSAKRRKAATGVSYDDDDSD